MRVNIAAKQAEITVTDKDIDRTVSRVAEGVKMKPDQLAEYLKRSGSSIRSLRRQIEGETAWRRLQQAKIESSISVGDEEVRAVAEHWRKQGSPEYNQAVTEEPEDGGYLFDGQPAGEDDAENQLTSGLEGTITVYNMQFNLSWGVPGPAALRARFDIVLAA